MVFFSKYKDFPDLTSFVSMQDKINDADRCQDVDKFCLTTSAKRRIDTDGQE